MFSTVLHDDLYHCTFTIETLERQWTENEGQINGICWVATPRSGTFTNVFAFDTLLLGGQTSTEIKKPTRPYSQLSQLKHQSYSWGKRQKEKIEISEGINGNTCGSIKTKQKRICIPYFLGHVWNSSIFALRAQSFFSLKLLSLGKSSVSYSLHK